MKSIVRWGATLGLIGSTIIGPSVTGNMRVLALTEKQVVQKLQEVPVFTIAIPQAKGYTLLPFVVSPNQQNNASANNQKNVEVARIFVSQRDAQATLNELKKNPKLPKQAEVIPMSLAEVYQLAQENKKQPQRPRILIEPMRSQVQAATALLQQSGQKNRQVTLPLFMVRFGPDKGYVPAQRASDKEQIFPIFFTKEQAQNLLNQVKPKSPTADIQVVDMDGVIETLLSKNDPLLDKVALIAPQESLQFVNQYVRSQRGNPAQNQSQPTTPQRPQR